MVTNQTPYEAMKSCVSYAKTVFFMENSELLLWAWSSKSTTVDMVQENVHKKIILINFNKKIRKTHSPFWEEQKTQLKSVSCV